MIKVIREYWDRHARVYDEIPGHGITHADDQAAWMWILEQWLEPPLKILDFGCGTGALSKVLARMGHEVLGIDLSPEMIARVRSNEPISGLRFDVRPLEDVDEVFDAVVSRHVFWSLPEPQAVLVEMRAHLRPGGRVLIVDGEWYEGVLSKEEFEDDYPEEVKRKLPLIHQARPAADQRLLRECGYRDIETVPDLLASVQAAGLKGEFASFSRVTSQFLVTGRLGDLQDG